MSDTTIFLIGLFVTCLCAFFVIFTAIEVQRLHSKSSQSPEQTGMKESGGG